MFSERLLSPILPIGAVTARAVMCSVSAAARPVLMASMRAAVGENMEIKMISDEYESSCGKEQCRDIISYNARAANGQCRVKYKGMKIR